MDRDARDSNAAGARLVPPFAPIVENRPAREIGSRLRVVLFNAAGGRRFSEIAACLKRPQLCDSALILLCEVNAGMKRRTIGRDVAAELAAMLGLSCAYIPEFAVKRASGELAAYLGSAILSAAPFEDVEAVAMHNPRTPRLLLRVRARGSRSKGTPTGLVTKVKFGAREITIGVAHLHSRCTPAERARQMATYMASFPTQGPAIFGGDLNTTTTGLSSWSLILGAAREIITNPRKFRAPEPHEPLFDHLRERGLLLDGANVPNRATFTFSGLIPRTMRPKLDWLAVRGMNPVAGTAAVVSPRATRFSGRASDHDFVTVELEL